MKKYRLEIIAFISGAAVMTLEITGSRILAPYVGASLFSWTSIIGIILGGLSMGYWWGGKLADQRPSLRTLSLLLYLSSAFIALTAAIKLFAIALLDPLNDLRLKAVGSATILFLAPSALLGSVFPYAARLKIKDVFSTGSTVGTLSALSTVGSIIGTFFTGFYLLAHMGSTNILHAISLIMLILAFYAHPSFSPKQWTLAAGIILIIGFSYIMNVQIQKALGVVKLDTAYHTVQIFDTVDPKTDRPIRTLHTDPRSTQSAIYLDGTNDLLFNYLNSFRIAEHFVPKIQTALLLGGGMFVFPKNFLERNANARMDVVEIDPQFTEIAKTYFNFSPHPRMTIYHEDARAFLNRNRAAYDVIFIDVFNSMLSIPFHVATVETAKKVYESLNSDGAALINVVSAREGKGAKLFHAQYATYQKVFPRVYAFPITPSSEPTVPQNIVLVALKSIDAPEPKNAREEFQPYLKYLWTGAPLAAPALTDDFAPTDQYLLSFSK